LDIAPRTARPLPSRARHPRRSCPNRQTARFQAHKPVPAHPGSAREPSLFGASDLRSNQGYQKSRGHDERGALGERVRGAGHEEQEEGKGTRGFASTADSGNHGGVLLGEIVTAKVQNKVPYFVAPAVWQTRKGCLDACKNIPKETSDSDRFRNRF
jgi:hypothetical protein